ncbi:AAA family ATPase [Achromobacter denitrificans]
MAGDQNLTLLDTAAPIATPTIPKRSASKQAAATVALGLLPKFVERVRWGFTDKATEVVDAMAVALQETHPSLADKLRRQQTVRPVKLNPPGDILAFEEPAVRFSDVVLPRSVELLLPAILQEHARAAELAAYHLEPRHRILLEGPPGNGKTLLAQALACELELPLMRMNYSSLITSHLGETGANLAKAFHYAGGAPCVLFLDEFDSIGASRSSNDVGEIRRVTNQLLLLIDRLPAHSVLICATNLKEQLDSALVRRFDFPLHLPAPDLGTRLRCAQRELAVERTPGRDVSHLASAVAAHEFLNLAALVRHCQELRRDLVLNDGRGVPAIMGALVPSAASRHTKESA